MMRREEIVAELKAKYNGTGLDATALIQELVDLSVGSVLHANDLLGTYTIKGTVIGKRTMAKPGGAV